MLHDEYVANRIAREPKFLVALQAAYAELEAETKNTTPFWVAYTEAPDSTDILTHSSTIVYRVNDVPAGEALRPEQV